MDCGPGGKSSCTRPVGPAWSVRSRYFTTAPCGRSVSTYLRTLDVSSKGLIGSDSAFGTTIGATGAAVTVVVTAAVGGAAAAGGAGRVANQIPVPPARKITTATGNIHELALGGSSSCCSASSAAPAF